MTRVRTILLIFGLPVALMGLGLALEQGVLRVLVLRTTVGLVSVALVSGRAHLLIRRRLSRARRVLDQAAREKGRRVAHSLLGGCQLHLPIPEGQLQIDFRKINPNVTQLQLFGGSFSRR